MVHRLMLCYVRNQDGCVLDLEHKRAKEVAQGRIGTNDLKISNGTLI